MKKLAPLISSRSFGPLGITHLPRLWLKILLFKAGLLPEGYRHGEGGFDQSLCEKFDVDRAALVAYVEAERPDYLTFEHWFETNAKALTARKVAEWNTYTTARILPDEMAVPRRKQLGLPDDTVAYGILMNDLDDWQAVHAELTAP